MSSHLYFKRIYSCDYNSALARILFLALCYFTPLSSTLYHLIIQKIISIYNGIVIAVPE